MPRPPLVVLAGPTASGKSALALDLAEALGGVLIAADSRTVYRGFDIGTAKPTQADQERVPHHLIDVAEPTDTYTVARFKRDAQEAIARAHAAGRLPVVVGGTGFYIRGLAGGLEIPEVPPQPELRARFEALEDPHAALAAVDPATAQRLHPNDRVRVIRALEVHAVLGKPLSEAAQRVESPYDLLYLVLDLERAELYHRINRRTLAMMEAGLVAEVEGLRDRYGADLPLLQTLGYAETLRYLAGEYSVEEAIAAIQQATRRYAKRQLTWFRGEPVAEWLDATEGDRLLAAARDRILVRFGSRL